MLSGRGYFDSKVVKKKNLRSNFLCQLLLCYLYKLLIVDYFSHWWTLISDSTELFISILFLLWDYRSNFCVCLPTMHFLDMSSLTISVLWPSCVVTTKYCIPSGFVKKSIMSLQTKIWAATMYFTKKTTVCIMKVE